MPEYENPTALAEAVRLACTNDQVRRALKANARPSVARFELGAVQSLEAESYDRLLQMKRSRQFQVSRWRQSAWRLEQQARRRLPQGLKWLVKGLWPSL